MQAIEPSFPGTRLFAIVHEISGTFEGQLELRDWNKNVLRDNNNNNNMVLVNFHDYFALSAYKRNSWFNCSTFYVTLEYVEWTYSEMTWRDWQCLLQIFRVCEWLKMFIRNLFEWNTMNVPGVLCNNKADVLFFFYITFSFRNILLNGLVVQVCSIMLRHTTLSVISIHSSLLRWAYTEFMAWMFHCHVLSTSSVSLERKREAVGHTLFRKETKQVSPLPSFSICSSSITFGFHCI